jgi:hypothetical protein
MDLNSVMSNPLFNVFSLTANINRFPFEPGLIGRMNLFAPRPITTTTAYIEQRNNRLALIPEVPRGAPANRNVMGERGVLPFVVPHFPLSDTVMADSILGVRAFGSEDQLMGINDTISNHMESMNRKHDVTLEHLRLGAIRGEIITIVNRETGAIERTIDLFQHFGVQRPAVVEWPIVHPPSTITEAPAWSAPIRGMITAMQRRMADVLGGMPFESMFALCGADFFDAIAGAPELRQVSLASEAAALRDPTWGTAVRYAGCTFRELMGRVGNYQFIEPDSAYFFPMGVSDLFIEVYAPAPYIETVNTLALRRYAKQQVMDFDKGVMIETQQNVLPLCTIPEVLFSAKATAAPAAQSSGIAPQSAPTHNTRSRVPA